MFGWFKRNRLTLSYDVHSHLLPGLDDGVRSFEESIEILRFFELHGVKKVVTTPHIYKNVYPNSEKSILSRLEVLQTKIAEAGLTIEVLAAAEYFLDEDVIQRAKRREGFLTWEGNNMLVETSFYNRPIFFDEALFELRSAGYNPVLAHPERYHYLEGNLDWLTERIAGGLDIQVNLLSLAGAYGKTPQRIAKHLLRESLVSFLGSDIHRADQLPQLSKVLTKNINTGKLVNVQS